LNLETCTREELFNVLDQNQRNRSPRYYNLQVILIKAGLRQLGRDELGKQIERPKLPDPAGQVEVVERGDIEKLIREAPTLQDRLIFEMLYELGARSGEIRTLRIKDVQFDEHGAVISLTGKTGTRRRRVYAAVPDLKQHLNNHRQRDQPNALVFLNAHGAPFSATQVYRHVRDLCKRIVGKKIHPHMFRHTRATEDSRLFTDREMMLLFGWKRPEMVRIYSHLSMRDVDEKDLALHGIKKREEVLRPVIQVQRCSECGEENAPIAMYCQKCGGVLGSTRAQKEIEELKERLRTLEEYTKRELYSLRKREAAA
jgi:integrase